MQRTHISYVEQDIKQNQNKLILLQIEHMRIQNKILQNSVDTNNHINFPIVKYKNLVLNHDNQIRILKQPPPPNPRMYL
mgnify:CR=1 FL=1